MFALSVGMTSTNPVNIDGSALDGGAMIVQPDQGVSAINKRNQEMTVGLLPPGKLLHCLHTPDMHARQCKLCVLSLPAMACDTSVAHCSQVAAMLEQTEQLSNDVNMSIKQ